MLRNYIKIAFRNLLRYKVFSVINILGLAVGLACCMLISLYVLDELSYDKFHTKADRIYRVTRDWVNADGKVSLHLGHVAPPFGPLLQNDFPDIEKTARIIGTNFVLKVDEKIFNEQNVFIAEPSVFDIFTIKTKSGDPQTALNDPFTIMLSEKTAEKYFGNENPVGKSIRVDNGFDVVVTGIFESLPSNSHFHPEFLMSFSTLNDDSIYGREALQTNFGNNSFATYLLLPPNYPADKLEAQFPAFIDKHMVDNAPPGLKPSDATRLYLQKMTDIHLHSNLDSEIEPNGNITTVYILGAIALFILLIACINFMNLSTALAAKRSKEVGIRKVVGVSKTALVMQFISESVLFTLIALALASVFVELVLPLLNGFTGKELTIKYFQDIFTIPLLLTFAVVIGLLAGSYPAFYLSSFNPVSIMKGSALAKNHNGGLNVSLRQVLVVTQFAISIGLIICTGVMYNQLKYISDKNLGFDKEHVVVLSYYNEITPKYDAFKAELTKNAAVKETGRSSRIPSGRLLDSNGASVQKDDSLAPVASSIKFLTVDHDFVEAYQMEVLAGRDFSRKFGTDDSTAFMLNETAAKLVGWTAEEAVGKKMNYGGRNGRVVGVLKDFNFESVHQQIAPIVFQVSQSGNYNFMAVKLNENNLEAGLAHIESTWNKFLPDRPYEYTFLDESFGLLYEKEQKQSTLFTIFSVLAIMIGCLGLFGLAAFTTAQRTKEIGIRKVLGASVTGVVGLLSKDFLKLVLIANLIAWPLAWWAMHKWLQDFAYRINVNPWIFVAAAIAAVLIALFTVSFQAIKAALANPVKSLRME